MASGVRKRKNPSEGSVSGSKSEGNAKTQKDGGLVTVEDVLKDPYCSIAEPSNVCRKEGMYVNNKSINIRIKTERKKVILYYSFDFVICHFK